MSPNLHIRLRRNGYFTGMPRQDHHPTTVTLPIPKGFHIEAASPSAERREEIVVTGEHGPNPYRLPLPVDRSDPYTRDCRNATAEKLQDDLLRAGRALQRCRPFNTTEPGDLRLTAGSLPGVPGSRNGGRAGVSLHIYKR